MQTLTPSPYLLCFPSTPSCSTYCPTHYIPCARGREGCCSGLARVMRTLDANADVSCTADRGTRSQRNPHPRISSPYLACSLAPAARRLVSLGHESFPDPRLGLAIRCEAKKDKGMMRTSTARKGQTHVARMANATNNGKILSRRLNLPMVSLRTRDADALTIRHHQRQLISRLP